MKKELNVFLFWIVCSGIILTFVFFLFLKYYLFTGSASNPPDIKDVTSNTLSFFSAIATISASIIAAYLFNDWKEQHNTNMYSRFALEILESIKSISYDIHSLDKIITKAEKSLETPQHDSIETCEIYLKEIHNIIKKIDVLQHNASFFSNIISNTDIPRIIIQETSKLNKSLELVMLHFNKKMDINDSIPLIVNFFNDLKKLEDVFFKELVPLANLYITKK